ncbi:MAG: 50S ribosomal protein L6 [Candidatus Pacearchaeota archaeon]
MKKEIKKIIAIPENVNVELALPKIIVKGPLGRVERIFNVKNIEITKEEGKILIGQIKATKKEKKLINSIASHLKNMVDGVQKGYEYKLQVCSIHFPITIKIDKPSNSFIIKNFLGENKDRIVKLLPGVEVTIDGDIVVVRGVDKEATGQMAANIETATRVRARDRRVFQDGIWIIKKEKGKGD